MKPTKTIERMVKTGKWKSPTKMLQEELSKPTKETKQKCKYCKSTDIKGIDPRLVKGILPPIFRYTIFVCKKCGKVTILK